MVFSSMLGEKGPLIENRHCWLTNKRSVERQGGNVSPPNSV